LRIPIKEREPLRFAAFGPTWLFSADDEDDVALPALDCFKLSIESAKIVPSALCFKLVPVDGNSETPNTKIIEKRGERFRTINAKRLSLRMTEGDTPLNLLRFVGPPNGKEKKRRNDERNDHRTKEEESSEEEAEETHTLDGKRDPHNNGGDTEETE
jgi:hypothetical protein